jgi:hypothetical protein
MIVYNNWDYWVFVFCPLSGILKNTTFWKLVLFPSTDERVVWPCDSYKLQNFCSHLSSLRSSIPFTLETESDSIIPFQEVIIFRKGLALTTIFLLSSIHKTWSQVCVYRCCYTELCCPVIEISSRPNRLVPCTLLLEKVNRSSFQNAVFFRIPGNRWSQRTW